MLQKIDCKILKFFVSFSILLDTINCLISKLLIYIITDLSDLGTVFIFVIAKAISESLFPEKTWETWNSQRFLLYLENSGILMEFRKYWNLLEFRKCKKKVLSLINLITDNKQLYV